jgi:VWFA-related protein
MRSHNPPPNAPPNAPPHNAPSQNVPPQSEPRPSGSVGAAALLSLTLVAAVVSAQEQPVFRADTRLVVAHTTVSDKNGHLVTTLPQDAFTVYENGVVQPIKVFRREDVPVSLGLIIDNSGSMRDKRAKVEAAALALVKDSNPEDEVFIVNFNDEYWLDQDFTSSISRLREALEKIDSRGGTALYDAVIASADHLAKNGIKDKKVLVVVTDGEDNASRESLERTIRMLQDEHGPVVYTIGILGDDHEAHRAKRALTQLAVETGGIYYFPKNASEVDEISRAVAHDIRNQYILGYKPTNPKAQLGYRAVKVEAKASGYGKLQVRTRSGYYAEQQRTAKQP